jgi:hypothetical protein
MTIKNTAFISPLTSKARKSPSSAMTGAKSSTARFTGSDGAKLTFLKEIEKMKKLFLLLMMLSSAIYADVPELVGNPFCYQGHCAENVYQLLWKKNIQAATKRYAFQRESYRGFTNRKSIVER